MKWKVITSIAVCVMAATCISAQSLERLVVGSAGSSGTEANVTVDYTIGETLIQTFSSPNTILTQGFHQPASGAISIEDIAAFTYSVYPNPFTDAVQVELTTENASSVQLQLTDLYGRVVYSREIATVTAADNVYNINTTTLAAGTYILSVTARANTDKLYNTTSKQINLVR